MSMHILHEEHTFLKTRYWNKVYLLHIWFFLQFGKAYDDSILSFDFGISSLANWRVSTPKLSSDPKLPSYDTIPSDVAIHEGQVLR